MTNKPTDDIPPELLKAVRALDVSREGRVVDCQSETVSYPLDEEARFLENIARLLLAERQATKERLGKVWRRQVAHDWGGLPPSHHEAFRNWVTNLSREIERGERDAN